MVAIQEDIEILQDELVDKLIGMTKEGKLKWIDSRNFSKKRCYRSTYRTVSFQVADEYIEIHSGVYATCRIKGRVDELKSAIENCEDSPSNYQRFSSNVQHLKSVLKILNS